MATFHGKMWGADARVWATQHEGMQAPLFEAALDEGGVGRGTRVLDLGCGAGGASVMALSRGARVAGVDASEELIGLAREAAPRGDFRVADVERLPHLDGSFDVVLAINVLQYAEDTLKALSEAHRVLAPGGRLAVGTWGPPQASDASAFIGALRALAPPKVPPVTALDLAAPGALEALLGRAGFEPGPSREVAVTWAFPDGDELFRIVRSAGPLQATIRAAGEQATKRAVMDAVAPFRRPSGVYRLENRFRTLVAAVRGEGGP